VQQGSDSVQGEVSGFFELQKHLVISMLRRLPVPFSTEEGESIQSETNTDVNAYRLLLEAEGVVEDTAPPVERAQKPTAEPQSYFRTEDRGVRTEMVLDARSGVRPPQSSVLRPQSWAILAALVGALMPPAARAGDPPAEAEVRALVESYRQALESKAIEQIAQLTASFTPRQRQALQAYFDNAADLRVEVVDVVILSHDEQLTVSFTRRDRFTDRETNRPVRLEVRLTKTVIRENGTWKLAR
jgi:hypothetical protein